MLNEKRNAKKVNKEKVKVCKIYRNVGYGSLTFVYILMHMQKLNENYKLKVNVLVKGLYSLLKKPIKSTKREKMKKYNTV